MELKIACTDGMELRFFQSDGVVQVVDSNGAEYEMENAEAARLRDWLALPVS